MPKGQSTILQYILFFSIGISLFIVLGNVFIVQYSSFNRDFDSLNAMLSNSLLSSKIIHLSGQCRECDQINHTFRLQNATKSLQVVLGSGGMFIQNPLTQTQYLSSIHNLNHTLLLGGTGALGKQLTLTYSKTKNILGIG